MLKCGFIQGRLSPPAFNHIQEFPNRWEKEFDYIFSGDFSHIEWIVTNISKDNNPLFDENISLKGLSISSICVDTLVSEKIFDKNFLFDTLNRVCKAAIRNNIGFVTIPLLEESSVINDKLRADFIKNIVAFSDLFSEIVFLFECELGINATLEILQESEKFRLVYDTGNITSFGIDHSDYIQQLHSRILNIHLKDRTKNGKTVAPLTGDTNFKLIFDKLKEVGYNGLFTLQTAREESGKEYITMLRHKALFEGVWHDG